MELENKTDKAIIVPVCDMENPLLPKSNKIVYPETSFNFEEQDIGAAKRMGLVEKEVEEVEVKAIESKIAETKVETKVIEKKQTKKKVAKKSKKRGFFGNRGK